jgi:phosphatidylglycerol---prolipoprotein diacylglyceryl transferase
VRHAAASIGRTAAETGSGHPAATLSAVFNFTPDPIALRLGPIEIHWYGIAYAVGLAAVYLLVTRLAARRGLDPNLVGNGMIVVAVAALIGGRLYHVIDRWDLYRDNLAAIVLPPYAGLGVYGGIVTGTIAAWAYTRWKHQPFLAWADVIAPGLFLMQAIGRWGNFFNQELYGPPTTSPVGIPIDCAYRVAAYPCATFPVATTRFEPLFLYESIGGLLGMVFLLYLGNRFRERLRPGDLLLVFFVWYGVVRFALESFRTGNWIFFGIPTAQVVSLAFIFVGIGGLMWRHRRRYPDDTGNEPVNEATEAEAAPPGSRTPASEGGGQAGT